MLITTSRKPSPKTRQFCKTLSRFIKGECINRGKMNLRDIFIKTLAEGYSHTLLIYESQGNPTRITFFNGGGQEIFQAEVNVALPTTRLQINGDNVTIKCDLEELSILEQILPVGYKYDNPDSNYIWIRKSDKHYKAQIDFIDKNGNFTGFKIYLKNFKVAGEVY